jgi:hypothetical protein
MMEGCNLDELPLTLPYHQIWSMALQFSNIFFKQNPCSFLGEVGHACNTFSSFDQNQYVKLFFFCCKRLGSLIYSSIYKYKKPEGLILGWKAA